MIKRVLVGLGGSSHTMSAIQHAIELARMNGAQLTGVSIMDEARLTDLFSLKVEKSLLMQDLAQDRVEQARLEQTLGRQEFQRLCSEAGIDFQIHLESGEPFTRLIEEAKYHDLMVFGLRGMFEFDVIPDPQDYFIQLVSAGVRPILTVAHEYRAVQTVVVAYSGSMESAKAMKRFAQSRLWPDAKIKVLSFDDGSGDAGERVAKAAEYLRLHGFSVDAEVLPGNPRELLLTYAEGAKADLIVMGNSGRSLILRKIFGETAMHTVRHSHIPLFLAQ